MLGMGPRGVLQGQNLEGVSGSHGKQAHSEGFIGESVVKGCLQSCRQIKATQGGWCVSQGRAKVKAFSTGARRVKGRELE